MKRTPKAPRVIVEFDPKVVEAIQAKTAETRTEEEVKILDAFLDQNAYLERQKNRTLKAEEVAQRLPANVHKYAKVRGQWVWIEFPKKPADEVRKFLTQLGFHFNRKRSDEKGTSCWQHAGGEFRRFNPTVDPRVKYGGVSVKSFIGKKEETTPSA